MTILIKHYVREGQSFRATEGADSLADAIYSVGWTAPRYPVPAIPLDVYYDPEVEMLLISRYVDALDDLVVEYVFDCRFNRQIKMKNGKAIHD